MRKIRVLIVDDSVVVRRLVLLPKIFAACPGLGVVPARPVSTVSGRAAATGLRRGGGGDDGLRLAGRAGNVGGAGRS